MFVLSGHSTEAHMRRGSTIGAPFNVKHTIHVDQNMRWSGTDPSANFEILSKLGEGAYGSVYKARHIPTSVLLAIKMIDIKHGEEEIKREITVLQKCKQNNIVSYYGSLQKGDQLWIIMDYCSLGSVRDLLDIGQLTLTEEQIATVLAGALKGLLYLHCNEIIHRDVKAANILLTSEGEIKIADFGVSHQLDGATKKRPSESLGTPLWIAPEIISQDNYDNKVDIWSLGITVIEMGDGVPPNYELNPIAAMFNIPIKPSPTFKNPKRWSPELNDFVSKCLTKNPSNRPTAAELISHPFIMKKTRGPEILKEPILRCLTARKNKRKNTMSTPPPRSISPVQPRSESMSTQSTASSIVVNEFGPSSRYSPPIYNAGRTSSPDMSSWDRAIADGLIPKHLKLAGGCGSAEFRPTNKIHKEVREIQGILRDIESEALLIEKELMEYENDDKKEQIEMMENAFGDLRHQLYQILSMMKGEKEADIES